MQWIGRVDFEVLSNGGMRCTPTRNEQCIIEEEKTEITGMFIEPGLKKRKSLVLHMHIYVLLSTLQHLCVDTHHQSFSPPQTFGLSFWSSPYIFPPLVWIVPLSVRPVMWWASGFLVEWFELIHWTVSSRGRQKWTLNFPSVITRQVKALLIFCVWCT